MKKVHAFVLAAAACSPFSAASAGVDGGPPEAGPPDGGPPQCDAATDFTSDRAHCGGCGRSCYGGECRNGVCSPALFASISMPQYLRIDGPTLYVGTENGRVYRVATDGSGGPELVFEDPGERSRSVAFDATHVFVASKGGLYKVLKANPRQRETISDTAAIEVAYADGAVFACDYNPDETRPLLRYPLAGGAPTTLKEALQCESIAIAGEHVFYGGNAVYRISTTGMDHATVAAVGARRLAIDDTYVYSMFKSGENIVRSARVGADGAEPFVVAVSPRPIREGDLLVDEDWLYWCAGDSEGGIFRAPKVGGSVTTIAEVDTPVGIAVDANAIYWTEGGKSNVVRKLRKPL